MKLREFELERYFARWEFVAPHLLCSSDAEALSLQELVAMADEEALDLWQELALGYTESAGHPLLRAEIANLYDKLEPEDILTLSGAEEGIFLFAHALFSTGGHAVVVTPAYQSLYEVVLSTGAEVTRVPLEAQAGWRLDLDAVAAALRPDTRAIVVNYPHSPTGALLPVKDYQRLVDLAREADAYLFSDEVYRFLEFDEAVRLPAGADAYNKGVSLGVLSKAYGLAGLRVGWIATRDRDLLRRIVALKDYTTICGSAPSEILGLIALRAQQETVGRVRGIVETNMPHLDGLFDRWSSVLEWVRPEGGTVGFPRLKSDLPVAAFADQLREAEGVLLLPGDLFEHFGNHFRLGFGRRNLPQVLPRLERFLQQHCG
ncbi:MAG: aminotransferase class I/II-fold pyridoxal phosphate-dependent enzyme [Deltaproteobacteria bacterium]|nr:aminotransferase class I/II-fold pyridoxal phosphate-dependent enzyme [Deltaproteobacteria bacterium]